MFVKKAGIKCQGFRNGKEERKSGKDVMGTSTEVESLLVSMWALEKGYLS